MKYFMLFLLVALCSCYATKTIPLKGDYPATPMIFTSDKPFTQTWDNLIDIFAQKGLSIKIIDKSSGLIVSEKSLLTATIEDKDGKLYDPNAFVAVPCYISNGKRMPVIFTLASSYSTQKQILASISSVRGEWNVRIKPNNTGGSTINVNITNLGYETSEVKAKGNTPSYVYVSHYKSTGVFEKILADLINR